MSTRYIARLFTISILMLLLSGITFAQMCRPAPPPLQPDEPLAMNTVVTPSGMVKTVKVEKEVFLCGDLIRDVNVFTEIIETIDGPIEKKFQVVTCNKNIINPRQTICESVVPGPLPEIPPCRLPSPPDLPQPPRAPLKMNTVTIQETVKTVKTEKEVFLCGPFIVDLNIFTEIREFLDIGETIKTFEFAMCVKDPTTGMVRGCGFF